MRKPFFSRHRFALLAAFIAALSSGLHLWADDQPVEGLSSDPQARRSVSGRLGHALLRSIHVLEGEATDVKFLVRGPRAPHPDVLLAVVDERSSQRFGLWPWPRTLVARAISRLHEAGAAAVGLDMIFADVDPDSTGAAHREVLKDLERSLGAPSFPEGTELTSFRQRLASRASLSPDHELAAVLAQSPEVVQGVVAYPDQDVTQFQSKVREEKDAIGRHLVRTLSGRAPRSVHEVRLADVPAWRQYLAQVPLPVLAGAASRLGFFNVNPDSDGTLRRTPPWAYLEAVDGLLPSLPVQVAATYWGARPEPVYEPEVGKIIATKFQRPGKPEAVLPMPPNEPNVLINHLGPGTSTFRMVSLSDVVDGNFKPEEVKGKAVLVGVTAMGTFDHRVTPFNKFEPGVFTHASLLSNLLSQDFLTRPVGMKLFEVLFMFAASLGLAWALPRASFRWKGATIVGALAVWVAIDQALFARGLQLATLLPLGNVLVTAFGVIFLGYLSVDREKLRLKEAFGHYVGSAVMEQMMANPERLRLGGEKKEMSVLFSDIRGFTTLAERMSPETLVRFINTYLSPMTQIVFDEQGTLDKYIGDAVMAFWGAPVDQRDHALRACRTALRFLEKLGELKRAWREQDLPEFEIGVGINSGPMIVGNMGSDVRFDYTVMGDAVNLASRLEGTNKEYDTRILVSETTHALVADQVSARRLGAVRVKGKRRPVRIYELRGLGKPAPADAEAISCFEAGVDAYAEQRFSQAEEAFRKVLGVWPGDGPSVRYLEELARLKANPPGTGWDGILTATTK